MKKIFKYSMMFAAALTLAMGFTSCSDDDNDDAITFESSVLSKVNTEYVDNTIVPTYRTLADYSGQLVDAVTSMQDDAGVEKACNIWKSSRKWWEFSEAFLFGAAGDFAIDPHIDTWPFDKTAFDNMMSKYNPATNEEDAKNIDETIRGTQSLTGFHAVEYLIFRDGQPRKFSALSADEIYFIKSAALDLYLNSLKLVSAWGGEVSEAEQALLDDNEFDSKNYGEEFKNAGKSGSNYTTIMLATRQIIAGAQDIIGEVSDSKIGSPATGEDPNYIESPNAYNSIQDFYDNIMSCKHALYGGYDVDGKTPKSSSLIGVCLAKSETKAAAEDVMEKLENALTKIDSMKKPFVLYYTDQSAKDAMSALNELNTSLQKLDDILNGAELK